MTAETGSSQQPPPDGPVYEMPASNGPDSVPPEAAQDAATKKLVEDVLFSDVGSCLSLRKFNKLKARQIGVSTLLNRLRQSISSAQVKFSLK